MLATNGTLHRGVILSYDHSAEQGMIRVFLFFDPLIVIDKPFERCVCEESLVPCADLYVHVLIKNSRVVFIQQEM